MAFNFGFKPAAPTPAANPAPTNSSNPQPAGPAPVTPTPNPNDQISQTPAAPVNPMDAYANLWNNPDKSNETVAPRFNLPQDKVAEAAKSMSFTKDLPPELRARIDAGEPGAMLEAIDLAGRHAYTNAITHSSSLTDSFVDQRLKFDNAGFKANVKDQLTETELSSNPAFQNPAARKHLSEVAKQMSVHNPDASPKEIAAAAMKYILDLAESVNPNKATTAAAKEKADQVDWDEYFGQSMN